MLSDKLLPRFYLAPGIKRLRIPPFCRRLRFRDRATPSLPQPTEYYDDFQFRKARTFVSSVSVGSNSAAFRRAKSANSRPEFPLLISTTKKVSSHFRFRSVPLTPLITPSLTPRGKHNCGEKKQNGPTKANKTT